MAILTGTELDAVRAVCRNGVFPGHGLTKAQLNAAIQAIEDWFEANRSQISALLNTATTPVVMSAAQKKALVASYLLLKYGKEK